jgi:hypothetical protein
MHNRLPEEQVTQAVQIELSVDLTAWATLLSRFQRG